MAEKRALMSVGRTVEWMVEMTDQLLDKPMAEREVAKMDSLWDQL